MTAYFQNPYLPHRLRDGSHQPSARKQSPVAVDRSGLPMGTAVQVMEWVGNDPKRAQRFLTKEQNETRPRVSLVANLKAVLKRHEIKPEEPTGQLATQIDVIPAERAAIIQGEVVTDDPVDQLAIVREKLGVESA